MRSLAVRVVVECVALAFVAALILVACPAAQAARSPAARAAFAKANPCPSTGKPIPSCPGYVIDHVRPLCAGGADAPENMQWQATGLSYRKDAIERAYCACAKTSGVAACDSLLWTQCTPKGPSP